MRYAMVARSAGVFGVVRERAERPYPAPGAAPLERDAPAERFPRSAPDAGAVPIAPATPTDDAIEDLGDEIATLAAHIHAATHRFLTLIAEFDRVRGWERSGHASCVDWLAVRCGIDRVTARDKVRTARALAGLPLTSAAMARGELSFCQARALTRHATPDSEAELLELACGATRPAARALAARLEARHAAGRGPSGSGSGTRRGRSRSRRTTTGCT